MFNAGVRGKRAKDGVGFLSTAEQFNQKSFLVPTVTSFSITDVSYVPLDNTAVDTAGGEIIVINGSGFAPGATVQVGATTIGSVTFIDQNRLAFTAPALSSGSYTIYVTNSNGGTGILLSGLVYSGLPTYTTTAGTLGTIYETANINTAVVATGDAPITYSVISGTLPSGATLNSNGTITGNAPVDGSSTTYSFTIQASDAQLQDSTRAFTLTISTDVLTWGLANNTVYSLDGGTTMSNVTLSATSSANSNSAVTFAANTLPTGVSLSGNTIFGTPTTEQTVYSTLTATATQTGRTATRFVSWVVSVSDLFFKYNTLAIQGADTTFVDDASTNNFAVTINGDTKPNNFNPYTPGYYSAYCATGGNYLTFLGTNILPTGTENFTFELWFNRTNAWNIGGDLCSTQGTANAFHTFVNTTAGSIRLSSYNTVFVIEYSYATIALNTWHHLAITRSGNNFIMWLNGVSVATATNAVSFTAPGSCWIGSNGFTGNISNLRVIRGTALYSVAFTPSTTPLTAVSGTSLLACQSNRWIDNSLNNVVITPVNSATIQSFDPFIPNSSYSTYGSGYFDGTGDYLSVPNNAVFQFGTGDFTVEYWVNFTTTPGASSLIPLSCWSSNSGWELYYRNNATITWYYNSSFISGTTTPKPNTWYHLAVTRSSGTTRLFVNGAIEATLNSDTTNFIPSSILYIGNEGGSLAPFTGYLTDVRIVKGTAVYTSNFTPSTTPLTAIANTSLLTLQNNQPVNNSTFLDNSTNNFLVTRNGNTTQGTFSPYGGNWSNYFDGTGDMLQTPSITIGTNAFCFECWLYPTVTQGTTTGIFVGSATNSLQASYYGNPGLGIATKGTAWQLYEETTLPTVNAWNHVAFVRSGTGANQTSIYINGVRVANGTVASNFAASVYQISTTNAGGSVFQGYISNARLTNGSTPYDATQSTITVPTTPLTPITNTVLLTCADNRLIDDSPNNFTITKNGDVSVQRFSPFNPSSVTPTSYSGYFDGTGDYLAMPSNATSLAMGTGNFTIEFWINTSNIAQTGYVLQTDIGSNSLYISLSGSTIRLTNAATVFAVTPTLSSNTWYHIAIVRSGTSSVIYTNGVAGTSVTCSIDFTQNGPTVGANSFVGYISNLRIVKGTAVYTENFTPSTTPLTAIANTSLLTLQSPTFIDNSTNNFTITAFGNSQPTIQNPFGYTSALTNGYTPSTIGGSGYFDGTGDYLSTPSLISASGDFTLECWFNTTIAVSGFRMLCGGNIDASASDYLGINASGVEAQFGTGSATVVTAAYTFVPNTWYHVAMTRSGTTVKVFVNGVSLTTSQGTQSGTFSIRYIAIGYNGITYTGYIADLRFVVGTSIYNSNFVPPAAPLTAVQNTVLLNNMTSAGIYDAAMMNNLETVGDAKLSTAISKFGGSSMSFDGSGDHLYIPNAPVNQLGTENYTIEFWIYGNSWSTLPVILEYGRSTNNASAGLEFYVSTGGGKLDIYGGASTATLLASYSSLSTATWTHIALTRASNTTRLFINGTQSGSSATDSTNYNQSSILVGIFIGSTNPLNGYIDDLRITKGYARYTSNFTPPTTTFKIK